MTTCSPPAPGVVQIEIIFKLLGQTCENVLHFDTATGTTVPAADLLAIANAVDAQVANGPWHYMGQALNYVETIARDLTPGSGGDSQISSAHAGMVGNDAAATYPNNVALCFTLKTSAGGKSGRGRMYLMGLTVTGTSDPNTLTSARATTLVGALNTFFTNVRTAVGHGQFVVVSKWHDKVCRTTAVWHVITSVFLDTTMDSQRRRLPGRGK